MDAWSMDQGVIGSMITFMGDPTSEFTKAVDMVLDHPGPVSVLGGARCKRFAIYAEDGVAKVVKVSEKEDDPAGDADPSLTMPESMLAAI